MALGAILSNLTRPRPLDSGGAGSQVLHGLGCDRRQLNSPVRLGWHGIPGASCPRVRSKAIELARSTRVVHDSRRFIALGANEDNQTRPFDSDGAGCQGLHGFGGDRTQSNSPVRQNVRLKAIELARSTRVVWDPRRFIALGAIEGNQICPFDSYGVGSQALHGLGCDRRQSTSPVRFRWRGIPGAS